MVLQMKKALFIGHQYHTKTKSSDFMIELLSREYDVTIFNFDPYQDNIETHFNPLAGTAFDVVILWQIAPDMAIIKRLINSENFIFFPMYDACYAAPDKFWYGYRDVKIISFSQTLYKQLQEKGLSVDYIQYFPKPAAKFLPGDNTSIFFWQRVSEINLQTIRRVLRNKSDLQKVHIHQAIDPGHKVSANDGNSPYQIEYSTWYEQKEDMLKDINKSQMYMAPRIYEGIGMSFLEAMAMGRCVIAPDNPTMNEYIVHSETGFLYDFSEPQRIRLGNVREIQKNAYEYIKKGYQKWEKDKSKILDVIESPVNQKVNSNSFVKPLKFGNHTVPFISVLNYGYKKKYSLFNKILLFKISSNRNYRKYSLLGLFSLTVYDFGYKKKYCLFHKIPLFKVSFHQNYLKYSLFGLFPFTIYNFGYKKKYCLFHKIPLFKKLYLENTAKFYLFGFVLLFTVEKEL